MVKKTTSKNTEVKKSATTSKSTVMTTSAARAKEQASTISVKAPAKTITHSEKQRMIAEAAYLRALSRNFVGGNETEDWLAAEAEINKKIINYKVV